MNNFFKKRVCGMCGNVVEGEDGMSFLHSRINGNTLPYHDDTTCSGSGKETISFSKKWLPIGLSLLVSALVFGLQYNWKLHGRQQ